MTNHQHPGSKTSPSSAPNNLVHFQVRHKRPPFGAVPLRRILLTMLDAIYLDTVEERRIVAIQAQALIQTVV